MKLRIILILVAVLGVVILTSAAAQNSPEQWGEQVAPGIEYREYKVSGPNNVFVARMDRDQADAILESSIAQGKLVGGRETVTSMAARYEDAINSWGQSHPITRTWGLRNDVAVAINGFYFNFYSGIPDSGQIHSGWYAKRYDNCGGGEAGSLVWKLDRSVFIAGSNLYHDVSKQLVYFVNSDIYLSFDGINTERDNNKLIIYTSQYDSHTPSTDDSGVEVLVEMQRPTLVLPSPAFASGIVRAVLSGQGGTMIPFDHIVLSAHGSAATELAEVAVPGTEIQVSQEITHYEGSCGGPLSSNSFTKSYASIGGEYVFLKDGEIQTFDDDGATRRNPRTAIAYNDDYIYFIVVDGRNVKYSVGMTIQELAEFALNTESIQATWGIAEDGGGSSTMVVNGEVKNNTLCNEYTCDNYVYLPLMNSVDNNDQQQVQKYQRPVANGMMMVVVKPEVHSEVFTPGETITTTVSTSLRLGPGTNYKAIATIPENTSGVVLDHINGLNGVLAKEEYWWKVSFGSAFGWVAESDLVGENPPAPQINGNSP